MPDSLPNKQKPVSRIPRWCKVPLPKGGGFSATRKLLDEHGLDTVCRAARCPNAWDCYSRKVATFLIMGPHCTRNCAFCNVGSAKPVPLDPDEPARIATAVDKLGLKHAVVTSVTRDDLPDGGAAHFTEVLRAIRAEHPAVTTEVLIPDFGGDEAALGTVLAARPNVLNHNVETAPGLYPAVRPQADYRRSLELLLRAKALAPDVRTKSGLMAGLGETDHDVLQVIQDLAEHRVDVVTIGQYMRPSQDHPEVRRYVEPDMFESYAAFGRQLGLTMHSGPLVRSSYQAEEFVEKQARD